MAINKAFLGHGVFTEKSVTNAINRYATYVSQNPANPQPADNIDRFINALRDMRISNVWIHLFSRGADKEYPTDGSPGSPEQRVALISRLNARNIPWAGWGYCAGYSNAADLDLIKKFKTDPQIAMKAFVIDAEPGNDVPDPNDPTNTIKDTWVLSDFDQFVGNVNQLMGTDNLAISTWPILQFHDDFAATALMMKAAGRVCLFAPQAYWMGYPGDPHYAFDPAHFTVQKYPRDDPTEFVRLVIDAWKILNFANPLVITGQAYWELSNKGGSPSRETMEMKINQLALKLLDQDYQKILGLNWYHAGLPANTDLEGSMSDDMIRYIGSGRFDTKPYRPG
jgi:hypothetical protein